MSSELATISTARERLRHLRNQIDELDRILQSRRLPPRRVQTTVHVMKTLKKHGPLSKVSLVNSVSKRATSRSVDVRRTVYTIVAKLVRDGKIVKNSAGTLEVAPMV